GKRAPAPLVGTRAPAAREYLSERVRAVGLVERRTNRRHGDNRRCTAERERRARRRLVDRSGSLSRLPLQPATPKRVATPAHLPGRTRDSRAEHRAATAWRFRS